MRKSWHAGSSDDHQSVGPHTRTLLCPQTNRFPHLHKNVYNPLVPTGPSERLSTKYRSSTLTERCWWPPARWQDTYPAGYTDTNSSQHGQGSEVSLLHFRHLHTSAPPPPCCWLTHTYDLYGNYSKCSTFSSSPPTLKTVFLCCIQLLESKETADECSNWKLHF